MVKNLISSSTLIKNRFPKVLFPFAWYIIVLAFRSDVTNGTRAADAVPRLFRLLGNAPSFRGKTKPINKGILI